MLQRSIYFLEYSFFRLVAAFVNLTPYPLAIALGRSVGTILYWVLADRRKVAIDNLEASFPEKSEMEIRAIACSAFQNMAQVAIEFVCIPKLARKNCFQVSHGERVWKALEEKRGLILIVSHLTNWEAMAVATGQAGFPIHAIGRPVKNPFVYNYIKRLRGYGGLKSIDKTGAIRETVRLLQKNKIVSFLIDQHERQGGVKVQFFGRSCFSSSLPARIATKWNVPVIATFCYRDQNGVLTTDFEEPFKLILTNDPDADVLANTQQFVSAIEKRVAERPGEWLWMHRRWRA
ncbi:MAG: lysophospholipid acyltransferase family protein [Candidatus Omnitrophica bacterium]|nr:lysophospholipid acyltransferase family protein [Candidatus Omnitrophota bacterium]